MVAPTDRLYLEFYAGGNVILTDEDLRVLSLLRTVAEDQEVLRVGLKYSLQNRQNYNGVPPLTLERVSAGLQKAISRIDGEISAHQKKSKSRPGDALRKALANSLNEFPPVLIDHTLRVAAFDPNTTLEDLQEDQSLKERLVVALREAQRIFDNLATSVVCKGYIVAKHVNKASTAVPDRVSNDEIATGDSLMYEDFHSFRPKQFENKPNITMLEFDSFNRAVDEFFSSIESQKLESRITEREECAKRKLQTAKLDHQKRLGGLQQTQELNIRKAQAIEANLQRVQEAIAAVNALLSQGMDWQELSRLIEVEQERHNVVANTIKLPLKLSENIATLLLSEATYEDGDDIDGDGTASDVSESDNILQPSSKAAKLGKSTDKCLAVDIDLALSPWSNARQYYEQKRSAATKEQKTVQSSEKALKNTEKKINADLKRGLKQEKDVMRPQRNANWFEKFIYFISSEGYLVLGGKDAPQNEMLYKKYLKKGDKYIHADLDGAASVIVKNKPGMSESPIPPSTLSQAGTLAVATSSAWDSKAVMPAWWVDASQVSKTTPTGDLLPDGSFVIQGEKIYLRPTQLLLGFGIMFKVSEESKMRHLRHRIQDPVGFTPSDLAKDLENKEEGYNGMGGMERPTEHQGIEDSHAEKSKLRRIPDAGGAIANGENDSEKDDSEEDDSEKGDSEEDDGSDPGRNNPLQPTGGRQSAIHLPNQPSDTLLGDLSAEPNGAPSSEGSGEQQEPSATDETSHINTIRSHQLSARESGLLRKGDYPDAASINTDLENNTYLKQTSNPSSQPDKDQTAPRVRGKRGKYQKIKVKYADQDEAERALAMRLLGSATAQEKVTEDAAAKADKEKELAAQRERRRKQHALAAEKGKEAEKLRKLQFEGTIETLDDVEFEGLGDLDTFVGAPLPGDEILDALVVCGPWDAIGGRYRWREKLQPGTTKKGKAVREILGKWNGIVRDREKSGRFGRGEGNNTFTLEEEKTRMREGELIKAIREPEICGIIPVGKIKVVGETGVKGKSGGGARKGRTGGKGTNEQR